MAGFTEITDRLRRICALITHIFEVNVDTKLLSEASIFIYTIRVHHVSLQFDNIIAINERSIESESAYKLIFETSLVFDSEIKITGKL